MTLHRFFLPPTDFAAYPESPEISIEGEIAHQLARVLRMTVGDQILLLDGSGLEYTAELLDLGRGGKHEAIRATLLAQQKARGEPHTRLTLFQGLLKGEKFDYVLQKGTEAGIAAFVPVISERCVSDSVSPAKMERWRKIIREAAEQSRRGMLPTLAEPVPLSQALEGASQTLALIAWEDEQSQGLRQTFQPYQDKPPADIGWLIGPEGGLTSQEIEAARPKGWQSVSLGPRIFRAETAGPIVAALTLYSFGDLEVNKA